MENTTKEKILDAALVSFVENGYKELIIKEAQKIEASIKKLMQLAPSKELEKMNSLIEKYMDSQEKE